MLKIKTVENKTTKTGKPYKAITLEDGKSVNMWSNHPNFTDAVDGYELDDELVKDGQYWNLASGKKKLEAPGFIKAKRAGIAEAQANKAQQISQAQDRSAWMWAKNNAALLIANNEHYNKRRTEEGMDLDVISNLVIELATKIYNGELKEPF